MCLEFLLYNIWWRFVQDYYEIHRGLLGAAVIPSTYKSHALRPTAL